MLRVWLVSLFSIKHHVVNFFLSFFWVLWIRRKNCYMDVALKNATFNNLISPWHFINVLYFVTYNSYYSATLNNFMKLIIFFLIGCQRLKQIFNKVWKVSKATIRNWDLGYTRQCSSTWATQTISGQPNLAGIAWYHQIGEPAVLYHTNSLFY